MTPSESLAAFLAASWGTPYNIGSWDCVLFVAAWADWLTGSKHMDEFGDSYRSENGGRNLHAPRGIAAAMRAHLIPAGWTEIPFKVADLNPDGSMPFQPGDIIFTDVDHPGIWDGERIIAQPALGTGLLHLHESHSRGGLRFSAQ